MEAKITLYFDTRSDPKNDMYPLKLRVYDRVTKKQKLYKTDWEFTPNDWKRIVSGKASKNAENYDNLRNKIKKHETAMYDIAKEILPFSFMEFERRKDKGRSNKEEIINRYNKLIKGYKDRGQIGTASNYEYSLKSIIDFYCWSKARPKSTHPAKEDLIRAWEKKNKMQEEYFYLEGGEQRGEIMFREITVDFLNDYQKYLQSPIKGVPQKKEKSPTTTAIYLRPLRAIFNEAISEGDIAQELYPFGLRKFKLPGQKKVNKALHKKELKALRYCEPPNKYQEEAKDIFFFSFYSQGMNIKDIAQLRFKDIKGDQFTFYRAKTINTSKANRTPIVVHLNDYTKEVLKKYGKKKGSEEEYVFSILDKEATPEKNHRALRNYCRYINQHLKPLAKGLGLPEEISFYWARHSFATQGIREGASISLISELLDHSSVKVTEGYLARFPDETKKAMINSITEL